MVSAETAGQLSCRTAQLSLRSTPSVEWPRYKERDARFGAGLEGSFSSFGETSLVVLTLRCQIGNGEETAE